MIKPKSKKNNKTVALFYAQGSQEQNRYLCLSTSGKLSLVRSDEDSFGTHSQEICFKDSYLFETLEDLYWQPKAGNLCAHLHPPTSPEMAAFMVQRYIIPVMRDLEIIQCGLTQALKSKEETRPKVLKAATLLFETRFYKLEEAKAGIFNAAKREKNLARDVYTAYDPVMAS